MGRWIYRLCNWLTVSDFVKAGEDRLHLEHHDRWQRAVGREIQTSREISDSIEGTSA